MISPQATGDVPRPTRITPWRGCRRQERLHHRSHSERFSGIVAIKTSGTYERDLRAQPGRDTVTRLCGVCRPGAQNLSARPKFNAIRQARRRCRQKGRSMPRTLRRLMPHCTEVSFHRAQKSLRPKRKHTTSAESVERFVRECRRKAEGLEWAEHS